MAHPQLLELAAPIMPPSKSGKAREVRRPRCFREMDKLNVSNWNEPNVWRPFISINTTNNLFQNAWRRIERGIGVASSCSFPVPASPPNKIRKKHKL